MISRFALQAVTSLGIVLVALMLTDGQPLYAQGDEGCHFLMHLRAPVEFTGPAGGNDFELYRPTTHGADILLSNVYGDQPCNWHASTNQNWLDLSRNSGEIAGGDDTFITVSVNDRAQDLSRGIHKPESTEAMCAGVDTRVDGQGMGNRPGRDPIDGDEGCVK